MLFSTFRENILEQKVEITCLISGFRVASSLKILWQKQDCIQNSYRIPLVLFLYKTIQFNNIKLEVLFYMKLFHSCTGLIQPFTHIVSNTNFESTYYFFCLCLLYITVC